MRVPSPSTPPTALLAALLLLAPLHPATGGHSLHHSSGRDQQSDSAAVMKVVTDLFNGMRTRDTALMRSTFAPAARLMSTSGRGGGAVSETPIDAFIASIARSQGVLDERIFEAEVRVDGTLATAWTRYEFWSGGNFSHCGYNSFQLARLEGGWKIIAIADSRRTAGCRTG